MHKQRQWAQADFTHADTGYFDGVEEIRFPALSTLLGMGFKAHFKSFTKVLFIGFVQRGRQSLHQPAKLALQGQLFIFR